MSAKSVKWIRRRHRVSALGDAEVQHLHVAVRTNRDVLRFDIAMNNTRAMRDTKRADGLRRDLDRFVGRNRAARDPFAQRHSFDELDRDVVGGIDVPDFVHGHDVG